MARYNITLPEPTNVLELAERIYRQVSAVELSLQADVGATYVGVKAHEKGSTEFLVGAYVREPPASMNRYKLLTEGLRLKTKEFTVVGGTIDRSTLEETLEQLVRTPSAPKSDLIALAIGIAGVLLSKRR